MGLLEDDMGLLTGAPSDRVSLVESFRSLTGVDPVCVLRTQTDPRAAR